MLSIVQLAQGAMKGLGAARKISLMTGHETPVLDEVDDATKPVRSVLAQQRARESLHDANDDSSDTPTGGEDSGFIAGLFDWFSDLS